MIVSIWIAQIQSQRCVWIIVLTPLIMNFTKLWTYNCFFRLLRLFACPRMYILSFIWTLNTKLRQFQKTQFSFVISYTCSVGISTNMLNGDVLAREWLCLFVRRGRCTRRWTWCWLSGRRQRRGVDWAQQCSPVSSAPTLHTYSTLSLVLLLCYILYSIEPTLLT